MESKDQNTVVQVDWKGPFVLQGVQGESFLRSPVSEKSGIYLFTVEYNDGYLIYLAGLTTRPFKERIKAHIRAYRKGTYTIFDSDDIQKGKRTEIWHGMWTKKNTNTPEMRLSFQKKKLEPAIEKLLYTFRIFFAPLEVERRTLARIEAAIMNILYSEKKPISTLPDKGMALAPRWEKEAPFIVHNLSTVYLYGLPQYFEA